MNPALRRKISFIDRALKAEFKAHAAPIIELIEAQTHDPFCVLVGTILSARTKDACTAGAVRRLFRAEARRRGEKNFTPEDLERLSVSQIEKLIYPVGFYHDKARHLKALPRVLKEKFGGVLPHTVEELCELPGVGRKTANLTVAVGFDLPAICVDVHVHRISNRLGLVKTKTPFETEMALRKLLPVKYWKTWNSHLVSFGQTRCGPLHPKCAGCPIAKYCTVSRAEPRRKSHPPRIALTGGIACGKSLVAKYLNGQGVETIDADDIVHGIIPDPAERKRLAAEVFADPAKRRALEARIHPQVKEGIREFLENGGERCGTGGKRGRKTGIGSRMRIAIIPLLFETHWDGDYDIICCVTSEKETQVSRMMTTRGYTREEAEARLAAQLPVAEKAAKSHYVIANDGSAEELESKVAQFVKWLTHYGR